MTLNFELTFEVNLNLENSSYRPFLKDNNEIIYVNIIKQLTKSIKLRLSPANKEILKP